MNAHLNWRLMTLHENPVASVKYLLGNLLQNQNENKGISDRTKIRNLRELRTRLLSEDFRRAIIKLQHHSIIAGQPQKGSDLEEDVSWGNIIRDLVDIVEYECSSDSCVRERKLSIHREMADTLQAVVRVALEDMSGTIGEGKTFDSLFKDFILNALRFAFTSLKDTRRKVIHPNIWCLARDIFEYATILQFLGRKQIAKWYELCFESFKSIETIDITSRRLQLTTARQIVVILMKRGQLFELADATLLRKLIMATIQSFQDLHNNIVADDDGISFVISTLFHILYQRGIELDSEMLHLIDDVATNSAWNLLKERKWRPGIVGYLAVTSCLVPRRNHSMKTAAYLITEYSRQTLNSCEETSEYLSYLLCLPQLLDLWQKQELSPDFTTYLLTFKLQSSSTVLREMCEQSELLDTLCTLFETTSVHEPTYRSREESKRDICVCCLHLVKLVSLYNEKFHISSAYKFFHISARYVHCVGWFFWE